MTPSDTPAHPISPWNLPNALTVLRTLSVPVFGALLLHDGGGDPAWRWGAAGLFVAAMITDRLDGQLARARGLVTDFGKIADPIADKALTGMAFVGLSMIGVLWWWVTIVVLVREWGITVLRLVLARRVVLPAGRGGKLKTVLQACALTMLVPPSIGPLHPIGYAVMAAAVVATVVTGIDYLRQMWQVGAGGAAPTGGGDTGRRR